MYDCSIERPRALRGVALCAAALALLWMPAAQADAGGPTLDELRVLEGRLIELAAEATPKTVMVQGLIGLGTGAVVDAEGTVYTNAHVAAGARYAILLFADGRRVLARRQGIDYARDLAVLVPVTPPERPTPHFALRAEAPEPGAWVAALGYPGGPRGDAAPMFTVGQVVEARPGGPSLPVLDYSDALRIDAPIFSGNSGGPLVDLEGRLVGINGAVDLERIDGLTIPTADVIERLSGLDADVVMLPGGRTLDPRRSRILRALSDRLDDLALSFMEAQLEGSGAGGGLAEALGQRVAREVGPEELERRARIVERLLERVTDRGRNLALRGPLAGATEPFQGAVLRLRDRTGREGTATAIEGVGLVACASSFDAAARRLTDHRGWRYTVVGRAPAHDLILLRHEGAAGIATLTPASRPRPVGSLVAVLGPDGVDAAGVLAAQARSIPATAAMMLEQGGMTLQITRLVERAVGLAEAVGQEEIAALGREILRAIELRQGFQIGSPPRTYASVLCFDAPVSPRHAGSALLDADGRLLGVVVANAHFGTSYAVPVDVIEALASEGGFEEAGSEPRRGGAPRSRQEGARGAPDLY